MLCNRIATIRAKFENEEEKFEIIVEDNNTDEEILNIAHDIILRLYNHYEELEIYSIEYK